MATPPVTNVAGEIFSGHLPPFVWAEKRHHKIRPQLLKRSSAPAIEPSKDSSADREQILLANLPLVRFVARNIHERLPQHVELEDLVGAGTIGLIDAFNKFDAGKNTQFRSYAQFRIRGAILDSLRSLDWGSRELRRKGRNIEEAAQRLTRRLNRRPSESEIAAEMKLALREYQELLGDLKRLEIASLQETHAEGSVEEELAYVPTSPEEDPLFRCMRSEVSTQLSAAIAELPEREARVLSLYYVEEMTLKEIGIVLGLVESRVSQIRASAIAALRARFAGKTNEPAILSSTKRKTPMASIALMQRSAAAGPCGRNGVPVR